MTPFDPKKHFNNPSKDKREQIADAFIRELAATVKGKPRKGGTFQTGKRSKAPRNIASRKPVKRK